MTWPVVGLVAVVLTAIVAWYALWAWMGLARARGLRDALRLEMEQGAVKSFAGTLEQQAETLRKLQLRMTMFEANKR